MSEALPWVVYRYDPYFLTFKVHGTYQTDVIATGVCKRITKQYNRTTFIAKNGEIVFICNPQQEVTDEKTSD